MAEPIDWNLVDKNDPKFFLLDPNNPNTNISASKYTVDASGNDAYNEFLRTAEIGNVFDFYAATGVPTNKGMYSKFVGFNQMGSPILETIQSEERTNWRQTLGSTYGVTPDVAIKRLTDVGYDEQMAKFLVSRVAGWDYVYGTEGKFGGTGFIGGSGGTGGAGGMGGTGGAFGPGTKGYDERKSAYDLLYEQFSQYGLGALVEPLKGLILEGVSPSEFTIRLRGTDAYKKRFAANQQRIAKGLRALSEAEYLGLEDAYQGIMRSYGLPASYYSRGEMGIQQGFEKFLASDVSPAELEDRIQTAQNRVINAVPEVANTLRQFYPGISNGDILAYALDPETALPEIKRKITAAEIGSAATMAGLATGVTRAEELGRYGITSEQARQGYQAVAEVLPRGGQLAEFYKQGPYTQTTAEQEVFGLAGATEAAKQRKKLTQLETAAFSGASGTTGGALARDRAGSF